MDIQDTVAIIKEMPLEELLGRDGATPVAIRLHKNIDHGMNQDKAYQENGITTSTKGEN